MEVKSKIREFISRYLRTNEFADDENILLNSVNSLFAMQLILFIENEFDLDVSNDDLDLSNFNSVNAISNYIETKLANM